MKFLAVLIVGIASVVVLAQETAFSAVKTTRGELVFSDERITRVRTDPSYDVLKENFLMAADFIVENDAHPVAVIDINTTDLRHYERYIARLTMAYLITDDVKYYNKLIQYLNAILSYGSWDWWAGDDLVTSHLIMGLSFAYDYIYDELDTQLRDGIKSRLLTEMENKFRYNHSGYFDTSLTRRSTLLGNHLWINNAAIYQGAIALRGDISAALQNEYINTTTEMIVNKVIPLLPQDGSAQEVSAYSLYGLHYLLRFLEIKRLNEDTNLYNNSDYFKNIMYCMHYMLFPDHSIWVNIGDHSNTSYWYSPHSFFFRLADEFDDPLLQRLGLYYHLSSPMADTYPTYTLFWFDINLNPSPAGTDPEKIAYFETNGQVVYRTSWDPDAMYANFICGPLKTGHGHPDSNHFLIYHNGNQLITDQGYNYWKTTQEHNTLMVDGWGQIGENYIWMPGDLASDLSYITDYFADEENSYVHFTGDATFSYRMQAELDLYERHFSILDNCIFIVDKVRTNTPKSLEINFHNGDLALVVDETNRFSITQTNSRALLTVNNSQVTFFLDDSKETDIQPTYYIPPYDYPGMTSQELYDYIVSYYLDMVPYETMTVEDVFIDFVLDGHTPPQHGFHLSQKTPSSVTDALFKNLLVVGSVGSSVPTVTGIDTATLTGYEFVKGGKKVIYLFNKTDDMQSVNTYGPVSFKGLMATALIDTSTNAATYYTKNAEITTSDILLGDVSENGSITAYDASMAARYAAMLITLTPIQIQKADVNSDGIVSAVDAAMIARYAAGLITGF